MSDRLPTINRIKTKIRVQAWLKRCAAEGFMATVVRKGDPEAGALFIKVNRFLVGCEVFSGATAPDGQPAWLRGTGSSPVPEADADAYLNRQFKYDSDIWILEIEDPKSIFSLKSVVLNL